MKSKNVVFRVDPGTYRQIEAEAKRRGLSVSSYVRLQATAPLVDAGPPDGRPLNQELKNLIAEAHDLRPGETLAQVQHFKRSVEAVMAAQSMITDAIRWLVNLGQTIDDLDLTTVERVETFRRAGEAVMATQGVIDEAARQLIAIGQTIDLPTRQHRRTPDARASDEGDLNPSAHR